MATVKLYITVLLLSVASSIVNGQSKQDEEALRKLPDAFSAAFAKHDAHQLGQIMAENVAFVTVGLTWLQGRADFEKYHKRLLEGRFSQIVHKVLETHVQFIRPDVAVVRHSWAVSGDETSMAVHATLATA